MKQVKTKQLPALLLPLLLLLSGVNTAFGQKVQQLTIHSAIETAMEKNPGLRIAALEILSKDAGVNVARGRYLPNISANASYTRNIKKPVIFLPPGSPFGDFLEIGSDNSYSAAFSAGVPVYNPALNAALQASRTERELAGEEYRAGKIDLHYFVSAAFFDALLAKESKEVMGLSHRNALENLERARQMHAQGLVSEYDLLRARVQVENLIPNVLQTQNGYEVAVNYLKVLIGLDLSEEIEPVGSLAMLTDELMEGFKLEQASRGLAANADLARLGLQMKLIENQTKSVKAASLPSLLAIGNYNFQTEANDFLIKDYNWVETFAAGLRLSIPIFGGFTTRNQVRQLEIAQRQMQHQKGNLENNLSVQLDNAIKSMTVAWEKAYAAEETVGMAARGYDIARARYETGQGTLLEVNDSELALTQSRFNLLQARHEMLRSLAEYEKITGKHQSLHNY